MLRGSAEAEYNGRCQFILVELSQYREYALTHSEHPLGMLIRLECTETVEDWGQVEWHQKPGDNELKTDLAKWLKASVSDEMRDWIEDQTS